MLSAVRITLLLTALSVAEEWNATE